MTKRKKLYRATQSKYMISIIRHHIVFELVLNDALSYIDVACYDAYIKDNDN